MAAKKTAPRTKAKARTKATNGTAAPPLVASLETFARRTGFMQPADELWPRSVGADLVRLHAADSVLFVGVAKRSPDERPSKARTKAELRRYFEEVARLREGAKITVAVFVVVLNEPRGLASWRTGLEELAREAGLEVTSFASAQFHENVPALLLRLS